MFRNQILLLNVIFCVFTSCKPPAQNNEKLCFQNIEEFDTVNNKLNIAKPILKSFCCYMIQNEETNAELWKKVEMPWDSIDINLMDGMKHDFKYRRQNNILYIDFYYVTQNDRFQTLKIFDVKDSLILLDFEYLSLISVEKKNNLFYKMSCEIIVPDDKKYEVRFKGME